MTQRILRARLRSPEGKGRFRLLLRLESPTNFRIDATHPLFNRRLWSLRVEGQEALLVDYLQKRHCQYVGGVEIPALPLGPFSFESLPALLLGYLPAEPSAALTETPGAVSFLDEKGRHWNADLFNGRVTRWSLIRDGSSPVDWSLDELSVLTSVDEELELSWRETVTEPLSISIEELVPGSKSSAGDCDLGWIHGAEEDVDEPI